MVHRFLLAFVTCGLFSCMLMAEALPPQVAQLIPTLQSWGNNPILIEAVKTSNARAESLEAIKRRDAEWRQIEGLDDEMKAMMNSPAAQQLSKYERSAPYFFEIFLMNNQGANVAMTNKTSDYWQGDEAKWQESFKGGKGAVHVGDVQFDESVEDYLLQISVPVMSEGHAIGAITVGVNLDVLEGR